MKQQERKGYPIYFKGNKNILPELELKFNTTIMTTKAYPILVPFIPNFNQKFQLLEPTIYLEVINDNIRELMLKEKYPLKPQFFYIYYPSDIRVDEQIYKKYLKKYENLVEDVPRAYKSNFSKFIKWEEGRGEHSIESQRHKINQCLSSVAKGLVQKKIESITHQIKYHQSQAINSKSLMHNFLLKNKMAKIYQYLMLPFCALEYFNDIWNYIMLKHNPRYSMHLKLDFPPLTLPKPPFILKQLNDVFGYFQNTDCTSYLRVVTFSFFSLFNLYLEQSHTLHHYEALKSLKIFIDFIFTNVLVLNKPKQWSKQEMMKYDISRNLWSFQIIHYSLNKLEKSHNKDIGSQEPVGRISKILSQYRVLLTGICSILRNSIERIGFLLFKFDNFSVFPKNLKYQMRLLTQRIQETVIYKQKKSQRFQKLINFQLEQSPLPIFPTTKRIIQNFETFSLAYIEALQKMYESLKSSPYKKVAESLKLTIKKSWLFLNVPLETYTEKIIQISQESSDSLKIIQSWDQISCLNGLYDITIHLIALSFLNDKEKCQQIQKTLRHKLVKILYDYQSTHLFLQLLQKDIQKKQELIEPQKQNWILWFKFFYYCLRNQSELNAGLLLNAQLIRIQADHNYTILLTIKPGIDLNFQNKRAKNNIQQVFEMLIKNSHGILVNCALKTFHDEEESVKEIFLSGFSTELFYLAEQEGGELTITLKSHLLLEDLSQKPLMFRINGLQLKFAEKDEMFSVKFISQNQLQSHIYHINLPELSFSTNSRGYISQNKSEANNKQVSTYYDFWTPITVQIKSDDSFNAYKISQIKIKEQEKSGNKFKIIDNCQEISDNSNLFEISQYLHFRDKNKHLDQTHSNHNNEQFYKITQGQAAKIKKGSFSVTLFIKANRTELLTKINDESIQQWILLRKFILEIILFKDNQKKQTVALTLPLRQIRVEQLFEIEQYMINQCQQWKIINRSKLFLKMSTQQEGQFELHPGEEISTWDSCGKIRWEGQPIQSQLNQLVQFRKLIKSEIYQVPISSQIFHIAFIDQIEPKILQPIEIKSNKIGLITIKQESNDFQYVGKISGHVNYVLGRGQSQILDIFLIPIRTGNLVLPQIRIDGHIGIWQKTHLMNVKQ